MNNNNLYYLWIILFLSAVIIACITLPRPFFISEEVLQKILEFIISDKATKFCMSVGGLIILISTTLFAAKFSLGDKKSINVIIINMLVCITLIVCYMTRFMLLQKIQKVF
jgi:hypothetical protein